MTSSQNYVKYNIDMKSKNTFMTAFHSVEKNIKSYSCESRHMRMSDANVKNKYIFWCDVTSFSINTSLKGMIEYKKKKYSSFIAFKVRTHAHSCRMTMNLYLSSLQFLAHRAAFMYFINTYEEVDSKFRLHFS